MSDFDQYIKRQHRIAALEKVLRSAKTMLAVPNDSKLSQKIAAIEELQQSIEEADKWPPAHISLVETEKNPYE